MKPERARLFAALELPFVIRNALVHWYRAQLNGMSGVRLIEPEALHVTLCFLGWQPIDQIEPIAAGCLQVASQPRMVLSLGEPLWLPPRRPRVLAIALEDRERALSRLQSTLARALAGGGWYERERRGFLAHVTVARTATGSQLRPPDPPSPVPMSFLGTSVALYRSRVGRAGVRYERLAAVQLSGSTLSQDAGARWPDARL